MSARPDFIAGGDFRLISTARPAERGRVLKPVLLTAASLLSLAGLTLVATAVRAPYTLAMALLGFAGYVFLMAKALECLPFDWDVWTNRREPAPRLPGGKVVPFGRGPAPAA